MELQSFVTRNFKPRENVREQGEKLIRTELKTVGKPGQVKVVITDQGMSFLISGVAHAEKRFFSSESIHFKADLYGGPRDWQIGAVALVIKDLIQQVLSAIGRKRSSTEYETTDG